MTARRRPRARPRARARGKTEHTEQAQVAAHLRVFHPDVLFAAVPNGGKRDKRTAAQLKAEGVLPGYPDLLIDEARGGYFGLRVEMKRADGGTTSKAQRDVLAKLRARGYATMVCHGAAAAIAAIEGYLAAQPTKWPGVDPLG